MGQMTFVPFLGKSFSFWLPIICVIVFMVTFFDAVKKLLAYIGFDPVYSIYVIYIYSTIHHNQVMKIM